MYPSNFLAVQRRLVSLNVDASEEEISAIGESLPLRGMRPDDMSRAFIEWFLRGLRTAQEYAAR